MEAIAAELATDPPAIYIDPGTVEPLTVQVCVVFHSLDGNRVVILSVVCPLPRVL